MERDLPFHVVGRDDVETAHVGEDAQHVLDVGVLEVERDALAVEPALGVRQREPHRAWFTRGDRLGHERGRSRRRDGDRGRDGRLDIRRRRLDRLHRTPGRLHLRDRLGLDGGRFRGRRLCRGCLGDEARRGLRLLRLRGMLRDGGRRRGGLAAEVDHERVAVGVEMVRRRLAEIGDHAQRAVVRRNAYAGHDIIAYRELGGPVRLCRLRAAHVEHEARRIIQREVVDAVGHARERDDEPPAVARGLDAHVAYTERGSGRRCAGNGVVGRRRRRRRVGRRGVECRVVVDVPG